MPLKSSEDGMKATFGPKIAEVGRGALLVKIALHFSFPLVAIDTNMASGASLRTVGCILLLLCAWIPTSAALDASEALALAEIFAAFPALSIVQQDNSLYADMNGPSKSWPSDLSTVCSGGDGYQIHGIFCFSGHVTGIYLYVRSIAFFAIRSHCS